MSKKMSLMNATKRQEEFVRGGEAGAPDRRPQTVSTGKQQKGNSGQKKKATFNLDAALHKRLKITAAQQEREMVEIVEEALTGHLQELEKQGKARM